MQPDSGVLALALGEEVVWSPGAAPRVTNAFSYGNALDGRLVLHTCRAFARQIRQKSENLWDALSIYESHEVFSDEVRRTLDLLDHIEENIDYFRVRIGDVAAFLPRNQPLYAFTCFVLIPSLMSTGVHFRVPAAWRTFFAGMARVLDVQQHFPNIYPSLETRTEYLRQRLAELRNVDTGQTYPLTEAVIFTGLPKHARQLRSQFDRLTLFISNGAGHNPVVVSETADLASAADAVAALCLYNQGQDCAAPNAILVAQSVATAFLDLLRQRVEATPVGAFHHKSMRVGPISDPEDLPRIAAFLTRERRWLASGGGIDVQSGIVTPSIFRKPLREGANYAEAYAPFIFVQEYDSDGDLAGYFETAVYADHAMYVTVYGDSPYVRQLPGREINGRVLHQADTLHVNRHLHAEGVERGTKPYGGYGTGASSVSFEGKTTAKPTLAQRDIFDHLVASSTRAAGGRWEILCDHAIASDQNKAARQEVANRDDPARILFIDSEPLRAQASRFVTLDEGAILPLLRLPNRAVWSNMTADQVTLIQAVAALVHGRGDMAFLDFSAHFYRVIRDFPSPRAPREYRQVAFQLLYQLLFARNTGPKLDHFLWDVDRRLILQLLGHNEG